MATETEELTGKVRDKATGEPLPFVNVVIEQNGKQVAGGTSDFDGVYTIESVPVGEYSVRFSFTGYKTLDVDGILINAGRTTCYNVEMESTVIDIEEF